MKIRLSFILLGQCATLIAVMTAVLILLIRRQQIEFNEMTKEDLKLRHQNGMDSLLSYFQQRRESITRAVQSYETVLAMSSCEGNASCTTDVSNLGYGTNELACTLDAEICPMANANLSSLTNFFLQSVPIISSDLSTDVVFVALHTSNAFADVSTNTNRHTFLDQDPELPSYWFRGNLVSVTSSWTAYNLDRGTLSACSNPRSNWELPIKPYSQSIVANTSGFTLDFPFPYLGTNVRWVWGSPKASIRHVPADVSLAGSLLDEEAIVLPLTVPIIRALTNRSQTTTLAGAFYKVAHLQQKLINIATISDLFEGAQTTVVLVWPETGDVLTSESAISMTGPGKRLWSTWTYPTDKVAETYEKGVLRCYTSDGQCLPTVFYDSTNKITVAISDVALDAEVGGRRPALHLLIYSEQDNHHRKLRDTQLQSILIGVIGAVVCVALAIAMFLLIVGPLRNAKRAIELAMHMQTDEAATVAYRGMSADITLSEIADVFSSVGVLSAHLQELKVYIPQAMLVSEEGFDDEEESQGNYANQPAPEDQVFTFVSTRVNETGSTSKRGDGTSEEDHVSTTDSPTNGKQSGLGLWRLFNRNRPQPQTSNQGAQALQMSPLAQQRLQRGAAAAPTHQAAPLEGEFDEGDLSFSNSRNSSSYKIHRTGSVQRSPGAQAHTRPSHLNNLNASLFAVGTSQGRDARIMSTPSDLILQQTIVADPTTTIPQNVNNSSISQFSTSVANPFLKLGGPNIGHPLHPTQRPQPALMPVTNQNAMLSSKSAANFMFSISAIHQANDQCPATMNSSTFNTPKLRSESVDPEHGAPLSINPQGSHLMGVQKGKNNPAVQHREASVQHGNNTSTAGMMTGLSMANIMNQPHLKLRRAAVAYINIRNFHEMVIKRPDAYQVHKIYATIIEDHVNKARGVVDSLHGDQFAVTFNVARSLQGVNAAAKAASNAMLDIVNSINSQRHILPEARHSLAIGLSSGKALVAQVGSDNIKKLSTIGPLFNEAFSLSKIAKHVGQHIVITGATNAELDYEVYTSLLGTVQVPNGPNLSDGGGQIADGSADAILTSANTKPPKEVPLFGIMERAKPIGENEWLYELNEWMNQNPYAKLNEVMETYLTDDPHNSAGSVAAAALKYSILIDKHKFASDALFPLVLPPSVDGPENQSPIANHERHNTLSAASDSAHRNPSMADLAEAANANTASTDGPIFSNLKADVSSVPSPSNSNPPSNGFEMATLTGALPSFPHGHQSKNQKSKHSEAHTNDFREQAIELLPPNITPNSPEWMQNRVYGLLSAGGNYARYTTCQYTRRLSK